MKNSLRTFRQERSLSQQELAEILEVSRQTIHSIESEKYDPSIILAFKVARFFDVRIEDIFEYEGEKFK